MTPLEKRLDDAARRRMAYDTKRKAMNIHSFAPLNTVNEEKEIVTKKVRRNGHNKEMHISVMK